MSNISPERAASAPRACLVTGAASGIGAASALRFAQGGWSVAVGNFDDSTRDAAQDVVAACRAAGAQAFLFDADVSHDADCRRAVDAVAERWQRLDAVINCAGTTRVVPHAQLEAIDAAEFERVYRVNLIGLYQMARAAVPLLTASATPARSSCVINISSLAGLNGTGSSIAYAASKGAVNALTLSLARNLAPHIRVNAIAPGMVDDGLLAHVLDAASYRGVLERMIAEAPLKRVAQPIEIAEMAWFLAAHAPSITGQVIAAENGLMLNS